MLPTVSGIPLHLNSSYYDTGNDSLDALSADRRLGMNVSANKSENATVDLYMLPAYIRTTSMIVCIVVMVLGIIGNLMVPLVVFRGKDMRNSTNIFLVNLSLADLCVLLVCTPTVLVEVNSGPEIWPLGEHMCKAVPFVELTVAHASVLTILAISFERYYAICEPLRVGYMCTKTRAMFLCVAAWVAAALCTSPIIWVSQYQEIRLRSNGSEGSKQDSKNLVPVCLTMADANVTVIFFLLLVLLFYLAPLLILIVLYAYIVKRLMPDRRRRSNNAADSYHARAKRHVIAMLLSVVIGFFLCLTPYRILIFYIVIAPAENIAAIDRDTFFGLLNFSRIMFYLHSAIDPILYNLMSSKFRRGFVGLCKTRRWDDRGVTIRTTTTKRSNTSEQEENFV
ncbi:growth hormone secretagogue receptor type 1-like isoform X3 [Ceratina calcarata]|uniref:Growth hormone secretagogue receptor type 1-like isoform X3 n=1 Tax=Ceratina calcarata TaxID=156304 RepID=A0AAJ7J9U5_9HYME|nr:growth hormone secretagogue receptor type 1-like isoform X3 [Ceratina calcarata]